MDLHTVGDPFRFSSLPNITESTKRPLIKRERFIKKYLKYYFYEINRYRFGPVVTCHCNQHRWPSIR
jgi:hypothetical protein